MYPGVEEDLLLPAPPVLAAARPRPRPRPLGAVGGVQGREARVAAEVAAAGEAQLLGLVPDPLVGYPEHGKKTLRKLICS